VTLTDVQLSRYARHIVLKEIGGAGQARLLAATVALVGAGGIGSPAIQYLAAAGVGTLILVDDDTVDLSNLQRQTLYATADQGTPKTAAAGAAVARLNPDVAVIERGERLNPATALRLLDGADAVIDGSDNFATRLAVADAALTSRVPLVSAAVGQFDGQLAVFRGWEADKPCYRCLVGGDPDRAEASCAEQGVLGAMTGVLGSLAALEAMRAIVPFGADPAGTLLLIDALDFRFRTLRLPKDPGCPACGGGAQSL
jgi:molybdopterin/thiamine biosynthesis adenylyltransferase